jgi:3-deoxy-manno-octulosonate cytidylyltransferase (CMP-KDO synthetase)
MSALIVIPARYGSTRFPGKPLALIGGVPMVERTAEIAKTVARSRDQVDYIVATDDHRIETACRDRGLNVVLTDPDLASGSDRALAAARALGTEPDIIVNLQGDAPLTPPDYVDSVLQRLRKDERADIATPVVRLSWEALDRLRRNKIETPFSGTTAIVSPEGYAYWFSKTIVPAIRKEVSRRDQTATSPVLQHVGLYAYRRAALERFTTLPPSPYEHIEGLEQLRALEAGMSIACVEVEAAKTSQSGIDTPEDLARIEAELKALGQL